jgi:hypothetical protein
MLLRIEYGGLTKDELLTKLANEKIYLNKYANIIFNSSLFAASNEKRRINIVVFSVKDLGFANGATLSEIINKSLGIGLSLCAIDVGAYLRLGYFEQKEEIEFQKNKAPKGSITILSDPINIQDEDFPKGFYIRKIDGQLWLRGYICPMDYVWESDARIAMVYDKY